MTKDQLIALAVSLIDTAKKLLDAAAHVDEVPSPAAKIDEGEA